MNLEEIMLSEISKKWIDKCCMISHVELKKKSEFTEVNCRMEAARGWGEME
jgi:hypothetical protein